MVATVLRTRLTAVISREPVLFLLVLFSLFPVYFQFARVGLRVPGLLVCSWIFLAVLFSEPPLRVLWGKGGGRFPLALARATRSLYWVGIAVLIAAYTRFVVIPYIFLGVPILVLALLLRLFRIVSYRAYLLVLFDLFLLMTLLLYRVDVTDAILSWSERPPYLRGVIVASGGTLSCQGRPYDLENPPVWMRRVHLYEDAGILTAAKDYNFVQERPRNVAGVAARLAADGCTLRWFHETFCRDMIYDEARSVYYASQFFDQRILMLDENLAVARKAELSNEIMDLFLYETAAGERHLLALTFLDGKLLALDPESLAPISAHVYSPLIMNCNFAGMSQDKRLLYAAVFSWGKIAVLVDPENPSGARRGVWGIGSWGIDFEPQGTHFYITDFFLGRVYKVDEASMRVVAQALLRPGIRSVVYDPRRRYVYVGDYYLDRVFVLDDRLRRVATLRSNGRLTDMALSRDGTLLYTAGWRGVYAIDLHEAVDESGP